MKKKTMYSLLYIFTKRKISRIKNKQSLKHHTTTAWIKKNKFTLELSHWHLFLSTIFFLTFLFRIVKKQEVRIPKNYAPTRGWFEITQQKDLALRISPRFASQMLAKVCSISPRRQTLSFLKTSPTKICTSYTSRPAFVVFLLVFQVLYVSLWVYFLVFLLL